MDDFKFDVSGSAQPGDEKIGDEEMLEALRRFAVLVNGRPFRMREFDDWAERPCRANTIGERFGSWRNALTRAGVRRGRAKEYDAAELMANLEGVWRALGRAPGTRLLTMHGEFTESPYKRRWGSVRRACEALARYYAGQITREELLAARPARATRPEPRWELRWRIMKRDRYRCVACGASPATDPAVELQIDHIVPVAAGGGSEESNLRTLCRVCNRGKGMEG